MDSLRPMGGVHLAAAADASLQWEFIREQSRFPPRELQCSVRKEAIATRGFCMGTPRKLVFSKVCKFRRADSLLGSGTRIQAIGRENAGGYNERDNAVPTATDELQHRGQTEGSTDRSTESLRLPEEGYIGLFVRMLGLDNPAEDREQAVKALWRHSMGGRRTVDQIVEYPGTLPLVISLLPSNRSVASEAAAGLLRNISAFDVHRVATAEAGAVEEITGLLTRHAIPTEVREQATGCLWNLSLEEKLRHKIRFLELLPVLVTMLESEGSDREAATGVLSNFALDEGNHAILVEAGIIPKLAKLLRDGEGSKVTRQEARRTLLRFAHADQYKHAIIEEGLVPVPLVGASAYKSFKPLLDVVPTLSEEVKFEPSPSLPSAFGAGKLLLGLNMESDGPDLDEATQLAIEGRARQHFLGRIGLLEKEARNTVKQEGQVAKRAVEFTLMPWWDGIPRLVLILGLGDVKVATLAASTISDIAINEEIRRAIQKAGSLPHLVRLLGSGDEAATEVSASAIERLAISYEVRRSIDAHGAVPALVEVLKADDAPDFVKDKVLIALARLSHTGEEVRAMIQSGAFPSLVDIAESKSATAATKEEAEDILEEMSMRKCDSRDKIINTNGVPALVAILATANPYRKEKAACVLENLAIKQEHAESIVNAGVEHGLRSLLDLSLEGEENDRSDPQDILQREETWAAVAAASRLLNKLLIFEKVRNSMDCKQFAVLLARVLKSGIPLHVKDLVSACLFKLDRLVGATTKVDVSIELEITLHDKIPRLVNEIATSLDSVVQEVAVMELRDLVSQGIEAYVVAISDLGGIFPLVDLLDKGTPKAREAALSVLYNIGMNDENHPALLRAGVVTHLQRLVRSGSHLWMLALDLLRALPT